MDVQHVQAGASDARQTVAAFVKKVKTYERSHKTIGRNSSVLVACSGGPDSVGLLFWLARYKNQEPRMNLRLGIAIIDHSLREESKAEVELVKSYGAELNIPVYVKVIDANKEAQLHRKSVETISRELRYAFFHEVMAKEGYEYLATAHHLDDQAETILAHLLRGTGTKGLTGMYPLVDYKWRPFLGVTKQEILEFTKALNLEVAFDKTNEEPTYSRNRLRLEAIPYLRDYNPNITNGLARLGEAMQDDEDYLTAQAMKALADITVMSPYDEEVTAAGTHENRFSPIQKNGAVPNQEHGEWVLQREAFHKLPNALYYRIWRHIMSDLNVGGTFSMARLKQLRSVTGGKKTKQFHLAQVKVIAQYGIIRVGRFTSEITSPTDAELKNIVYRIDQQRLVTWHGPEETVPLQPGECILISRELAPSGPTLRRRMAGDRIALRDGNGKIWGHKKLKDWLIDRKIPKEQREDLWFCCAGNMAFDMVDTIKQKSLIVWEEQADTYWACSIKEEYV